jgi:hypothetical protein
MIDHTSDFSTSEPSHIHIPRPSRLKRALATASRRPGAPLDEHAVDVYRDVVRTFAVQELEPAGTMG